MFCLWSEILNANVHIFNHFLHLSAKNGLFSFLMLFLKVQKLLLKYEKILAMLIPRFLLIDSMNLWIFDSSTKQKMGNIFFRLKEKNSYCDSWKLPIGGDLSNVRFQKKNKPYSGLFFVSPITITRNGLSSFQRSACGRNIVLTLSA